jgi:hypothetical protein
LRFEEVPPFPGSATALTYLASLSKNSPLTLHLKQRKKSFRRQFGLIAQFLPEMLMKVHIRMDYLPNSSAWLKSLILFSRC